MYDVQFGASTVLPNIESDEELDRRIKSISEAGFAGIEISAAVLSNEERVSYVWDLCNKHQIAPVSTVWPLDTERLKKDSETTLKEITSLIERTDGLGAEYFIISEIAGNGDSSEEETLELMRQAKEQCASLGLRLSYLPSDWEKNILIQRLAEVAGEELGFAYNLSRMTKKDFELSESVLRFAPRWNYVVLPPLETQSYDHSVKWEDLAHLLDQHEFTGWLMVKSPSLQAVRLSATLKNLKVVFGN